MQDSESIKKVLALFDPEDIPYIKSELLLALITPPEKPKEESEIDLLKMKKIGEKK